MITEAIAGRGSKLMISPDGVTFTRVGQLRKFGFGGMKQKLVDVSAIGDLSAMLSMLGARVDPGAISFDGVANPWDPGYALALEANGSPALYWFQVLIGTGTPKVSFQGWLSEFAHFAVDYSKETVVRGSLVISGGYTISVGGFLAPGFEAPGFQTGYTLTF